MYYGYVYKFTCLVTHKIYVGQHKSSTFDENYWGSGKLWTVILEEYGYDCISREVLEWCETAEKLYAQERFWISKLDARNQDIGYNISAGGYTPSLPGESNPMFGKTHTEEAKSKISKTNKGIKRTAQFKEKRRQYMKDKRWYNNGVEERYFSADEVSPGYVLGRMYRSSRPLSDKEQVIQKVKNALGDSYKHLPKKVFHNGEYEVMLPVCPEGFVPGRLPAHQATLTSALKGKPFSEEGKSKLSARMSGNQNPMYGVHRSGSAAPTWGMHHSDTTKKLIQEKLRGRVHVTDGQVTRSVHPEDVQEYIDKGFRVKKST